MIRKVATWRVKEILNETIQLHILISEPYFVLNMHWLVVNQAKSSNQPAAQLIISCENPQLQIASPCTICNIFTSGLETST